MAGLGSRFVKQGYKVPKQLIYCHDKQLIDISLTCLNWQDANLIFVVRDDMVYNFHIDQILKQKFGEDIKICVLNQLTRGSVESCLAASEFIDNDHPLIIHTLDIEFHPGFDVTSLSDFQYDGLILTFKSNSSNYSYAQVNSNGDVVRTAEKKPISEYACVGIYCFKQGKQFVHYAKQMIEKNILTNNEFYITPLYNLLIEDGLKISQRPVDKMHVFGTPEEFDFYKQNVVKKLGTKPVALCSDHSGYDAKELMKQVLHSRNMPYIDFGTAVNADCDYADYIQEAVTAMKDGTVDFAFGFCRSGQGVNICANKHKAIRSALIYNEYAMEMCIRHNCANFFAIPSKNITKTQLEDYLSIAASTSFDGGRHQMRIQNLEK